MLFSQGGLWSLPLYRSIMELWHCFLMLPTPRQAVKASLCACAISSNSVCSEVIGASSLGPGGTNSFHTNTYLSIHTHPSLLRLERIRDISHAHIWSRADREQEPDEHQCRFPYINYFMRRTCKYHASPPRSLRFFSSTVRRERCTGHLLDAASSKAMVSTSESIATVILFSPTTCHALCSNPPN